MRGGVIMDIKLLQELMNSDTMSNEVLEILETMKKKKVNEVHSYIITPPKDSNNRWQTYIKGDDNKRVKITSTTENGLYEKLYNHYFGDDKKILKDLYPVWLEKRRDENVSVITIRKNRNHWDKYYKDNKVVNIQISKITVDDIESFFNEAIRKHSITVKELNNMKFIFKDMMKYAKRKKLITYNPFDEIEINLNACMPQKKKSDSSRVYLPQEKEKLFIVLNDEIARHPDKVDTYMVFLLFRLGLRIGELCALKWEDISCNEIHVHRMETMEEDKNGKMLQSVVEYTKKKSPSGDRFLPLGDYEKNIFNSIQKLNETYNYNEGDYIFCDEQGRRNLRKFDKKLRKYCRMAGIEEKSSHDIRRTVASELHSKGISIEIIRNFLGHADTKTTWGYILDNNSKEETSNKILQSLINLCGCTQAYSIM